MSSRWREWAQGAVTRALIAAALVAALIAAGVFLSQTSAPSSALSSGSLSGPSPLSPLPIPKPIAGGAAEPATLEVSSPTAVKTPSHSELNLANWSARVGGAVDIPASALTSYASAELALRTERPQCHLSWVTLAGMGKTESDHGRRAPDIPGIGVRPESATAAGRTLCADGVDLRRHGAWWKAVGNYRNEELFRQQVLGYAQLYATLSTEPELKNTPATAAVRFALGQLGLPYVWGGNGPEGGSEGFDCSGLTKASYDAAHRTLPRTADSQFRSLAQVTHAEPPRLGDLVFYGNAATKIDHVGLYLGNGLMINAPSQGYAIQIHPYRKPGDDYAGAARV